MTAAQFAVFADMQRLTALAVLRERQLQQALRTCACGSGLAEWACELLTNHPVDVAILFEGARVLGSTFK